MKYIMDQILEGHHKQTMELNRKMDSMYANMNGKFEAFNSHVKILDIQVAQTVESVKRQE